MKSLIVTTLMGVFVLFSLNTFAQDGDATEAEADTVAWTWNGFTTLNLNQVALVNWAAGGENSFSATLLGYFKWKYSRGEKTYWESYLDLAYGVLKPGKDPFQKNEDKIILDSKFGYEIDNKGHFYATTLLNFKSQFAPGFNLPDDSTVVSRFMAPAWLVLSTGVEYKPKPWFSLYLSPATGKFTFVLDDALSEAGAFGVNEGKKVRAEFGAYATVMFDKELFKNVNLKTKAEIFNNYTDPNKENRVNFDVNWETTIDMTINKFLSASIFLHLIYDQDIDVAVDTNDDGEPDSVGPRTQFKEVLGIGLSYKFKSKNAE